jgi:alpha-1,6-mannosyltransferase
MNSGISHFIVRIVLGTAVVVAFSAFRRSVARFFGPQTNAIICLLTLSQFHFLFYASRTLPNTFALILVLWSLKYWIESQYDRMLFLLVFASVIFRSELCLLAGPILILEIYRRRIYFFEYLFKGIKYTLFCLGKISFCLICCSFNCNCRFILLAKTVVARR